MRRPQREPADVLYTVLRLLARVALRWYYADVAVQGRERIPPEGPVIIVANHPNALVDALLAATALGRDVRLTAKATLFAHPLLAPLLRATGVVPLRRLRDELVAAREGGEGAGAERSGPGRAIGRADVQRNEAAFARVSEALRRGQAVLVFPEGISHDAPALAPLRSGAARMALAACDAGVAGVVLLAVGLIYEEKDRPRSRVLVRIGDPLHVGAWTAVHPGAGVGELTAEMENRLRAVTLNFASEERARSAVRLARALQAISEPPPGLSTVRALAREAEIAARVESATERLTHAPPALVARADALTGALDQLERELATRGIALDEVTLSTRRRHGARFVVRETALGITLAPIAILGRVAHALPLRIAGWVARRSARGDSSRDQPAMRTIVLGTAGVLLWYAGAGMLIATRWGAGIAIAAVSLAAVAGRVSFLLGDRSVRAWRRARSYLSLRRDPAAGERACATLRALLEDALALEEELRRVEQRSR